MIGGESHPSDASFDSVVKDELFACQPRQHFARAVFANAWLR
jgi:hypothetical protein